MKKFFAGLIVGVLLIFSHAGGAMAADDTVYAPWYNETANYNTWLLFSNTGTAVASGDLTIIAINTGGTTIGSTTPTISANKNWVFALTSAINATSTTGNQRGQLRFTGTDTVLNNLNMFVVVQGTGTRDAGFVVPIYGAGTGTGNKYAPQ